ncbi:MAG: hypothetical protein ACT4TC_06610 [Myxococcaceae bacterium]
MARLSPAVICLVEREGACLLARNAHFARPFRSPRYYGSQPWPFTNSLMIGFHADYAGGELKPDGKEIADARWYSPSEMPELPPRLSISLGFLIQKPVETSRFVTTQLRQWRGTDA